MAPTSSMLPQQPFGGNRVTSASQNDVEGSGGGGSPTQKIYPGLRITSSKRRPRRLIWTGVVELLHMLRNGHIHHRRRRHQFSGLRVASTITGRGSIPAYSSDNLSSPGKRCVDALQRAHKPVRLVVTLRKSRHQLQKDLSSDEHEKTKNGESRSRQSLPPRSHEHHRRGRKDAQVSDLLLPEAAAANLWTERLLPSRGKTSAPAQGDALRDRFGRPYSRAQIGKCNERPGSSQPRHKTARQYAGGPRRNCWGVRTKPDAVGKLPRSARVPRCDEFARHRNGRRPVPAPSL